MSELMEATEDNQSSAYRPLINKSPSLSDLAYREIENMILGGEIGSGKRLNDSLLARQFGISRGPIREAINRLAAAGLVNVVQNRGAFVRVIDLRDALEIYDLRAGLERVATMKAAQLSTPALVDSLTEAVESMDAYFQANQQADYFKTNLHFHRTIYEASGNQRLIESTQRLERELQLFRKFSIERGGMMASNRGHWDILEAIRDADPRLAGDMMEKHVWQAKERLIQVSESHQSKDAILL
jgi:DNA-binding GntR family transcriptional regulator